MFDEKRKILKKPYLVLLYIRYHSNQQVFVFKTTSYRQFIILATLDFLLEKTIHRCMLWSRHITTTRKLSQVIVFFSKTFKVLISLMCLSFQEYKDSKHTIQVSNKINLKCNSFRLKMYTLLRLFFCGGYIKRE